MRLRLPSAGNVVDQYVYTSTVQNVSVNRAPDADPDAGFVLHDTLPSGRTSSPGKRADGSDF